MYWGCKQFPAQQLDDGRELEEINSNNSLTPFNSSSGGPREEGSDAIWPQTELPKTTTL